MDLLFGSTVVEQGKRLGRLAGVEIDPAARRALKIVVTRDGRLGPYAQTRPVEVVRVEGAAVMIAQEAPPSPPLPFRLEPLLWSRGTHVLRGHVEVGRLLGVRVEEGSGRLEAAFNRKGRWAKTQTLPVEGLDLSVIGELRLGPGSQAA
jgi:hypothetical protein